MKELDYEISNGHYTLVVTATDQCPNPALRLTSSTTVSTVVEHCIAENESAIGNSLLFYLINHLTIIYIQFLNLFLSDSCLYNFLNPLLDFNTTVDC